jgi:hypothetical protein
MFRFLFASKTAYFGNCLVGRVALGKARWAALKTAERISMGRVALGWLGEPTTRGGRLWLSCAVAELCHSTNKVPSKTTQIQAACVDVNR